jgi:hypothetical protein
MAKIERYDGNLKAFASEALGTERTVFGDTAQSDLLDDNINADFLRGWGIVGVNQAPTKQDFAGLGFTLGQLVAYLHQTGVAEWNGLQRYQIGSFANSAGVLYVCKTLDHISATVPEADATNWKPLIEASGLVTGTATFTNSTNNILLTGLGNITGLEVGDVIEVSGSVSNNTQFTIEVITDANNVIVNQAHAGGSTSKSLTNETSTSGVSVKLLAKWYSAGIGIGQGVVNLTASRVSGTTYTNTTGRSISIVCSIDIGTSTLALDGITINLGEYGPGVILQYYTFIVRPAGTYVFTNVGLSTGQWLEAR